MNEEEFDREVRELRDDKERHAAAGEMIRLREEQLAAVERQMQNAWSFAETTTTTPVVRPPAPQNHPREKLPDWLPPWWKSPLTNEFLLSTAGDSEVIRAAWQEQLHAVGVRLQGRLDISKEEQAKVASYLGRRESARIFDEFVNAPDQVIAASLVGAGLRSMDAAEVGLEPTERAALDEFLRTYMSTEAPLTPRKHGARREKEPVGAGKGENNVDFDWNGVSLR